MRFSKADIAFTAIIIAGIALLSGMLYLHNRKQKVGSGDAIGKVFYKREIAMRKFADRLVWDDVESGSPLYPHDAVMTGNYSDAELVLHNGLRLKLEANTLIELDLEQGGLNLRLAGGGVKASGTADARATITTNSGQSISLRNADASIRATDKNTAVEVASGQVIVANKDGSQLAVNKNEVLSGQNRYTTTLQITGLAEDTVILATGNRGRVELACPGGERVEFSRHSDMEAARIIPLTAGKASTQLASGDWYARCRGAENTISAVRHFRILEAGSYRLFRPGATVNYRDKPEVVFEFRPPRGVAKTRLEVSTDAEFAKIAVQQTLSEGQASIALPEAGRWYYRLSPIADDRSQLQLNRLVGSFNLLRQALESRVRFSTLAEPVYSLAQVEAEKAIIMYEGTGSYRYEIRSRDTGFALARGDTTGGFVKLPRNLSVGKYELIISDGEARAVQTFTIQGELTVEIIIPSADSTIWVNPGTTTTAIEASWRASAEAELFQVTLASDAEMKKILRKITTDALQTQFMGLYPGMYFLRVAAYENNVLRAESKTVRVKIEDRLKPVAPLYPRDEQKVDVTKTERLDFRWQPVVGATAYEIRLLQRQGTGFVPIETRRTETTHLSFTNLRKIHEGELVWEVRALRTDKAGKIMERSEPVKNRVRISFGPLPATPEVIPVVEE